MKTTNQMKTSVRHADGKISYSRGIVQDVSGNLATVKLQGSNQVRVRTDVMFGRSAPAREGEQWMVAQEFGDWRFVAHIGEVDIEVRRFVITIGNGSATTFTLEHGLGTKAVHVQVFNPISGVALTPTVTRIDVNHVQVVFSPAPATGAAEVVILG